MGTDGAMHELSSSLAEVLHDSSFEAQSYADLCGRCHLLLCHRRTESDRKDITRATVIELSELGHITTKTELTITLVQENQKVGKDVILTNYQGELLQVRAAKISKKTSEPVLSDQDDSDRLKLVSFDKMV